MLSTSLLLPLTACGSSSAAESKVDAQETYGCNVLNVYNWGEYIDTDLIPQFEKEYQAKVNYDLYESNEIMYTKLLGGSSYDILIPSDYMVQRLIDEKLLQELDMSIVTDRDGVLPEVSLMQKAYDPEQKYSMPYLWGAVGLVYNKNTVDPEAIEKEGWDILLDETYKGKIFFYDSQRDAFMVALKALGYSMNTESDEEIQAAYEWLKDMNDRMDPSYVTDEVIDEMVNGTKDIAVMYSGDAAYVLSQNEDMAWVEPNQGTNHWSDAMVIPANAGCPGLANAFINYMSGYDQAYAVSETVGYSSTNQQVLEELSTGEYEGNDAYLPREGYEKDEVFVNNEVLRQKLSDLWNKVKIGK